MVPETRIALIVDKDAAPWRAILGGVLEFSRSQPAWILHSVRRLDEARLEILRRWRPAGVIARVESAEVESALMGLGVPVVCFSSSLTQMRLPLVRVDDHAIGRMIGDHFLTYGLRHFTYFGPENPAGLEQRAGFLQAIEEAGISEGLQPAPSWTSLDMSQAWTSSDQVLGQWLHKLPRPFGLMLHNDEWGLWLTQVCRQAGLRVPEDVAIVGVNDDELNCTLATPPLSSVRIATRRMGHAAASLLERLLSGRTAPSEPIRVAPLAVTVRQSSSVLAVEDADVAAAVHFIGQASAQPLSVDDVLRHVPVARRVLERKFKAMLGRTPLQEIRRAHLNRAKELLARTDLKLDRVAARSGFGSMYHLCRIFKRETSQTPMEYRRQFRHHD
ncbi:MAG: substrate-binding domain-containing protein [Phycisphaerae bacterium]